MPSMFLLLPVFGSNVLHQWIMFAKLLYFILVSFHYTERQANKWVVVFMFTR